MMGRLAIIIIAFLFFESCTAISAHHSNLPMKLQKMHCVFHRESDDTDSCLLGFMETICQAKKCLRTVGQSCSHNQADKNLYGTICGAGLTCGCDEKCSGCMLVNGKKICHDDSLFCLGKRSGSEMADMQMQDEFEYPVENRILRMID